MEAGDDVDVDVHHRLPGGLTGVEADVVGVGFQLAIEVSLHAVDEIEQRRTLLDSAVEEVRDVPPRHDERVAGGDGVAVAEGEGERVLGDDLGR